MEKSSFKKLYVQKRLYSVVFIFGRRTTLPFCRTYVLTARQLFNIPSCPSCFLKTVNLILFPPISICRLEKEYELPYFLSSLEAFQLIQMKKVVPAPAR